MRGRTTLGGLLTLLALPATAAAGETAVGVTFGPTSPQVVTFDTDAPQTLRTSAPITGLNGGEQVEAIDARPSTGQVFVWTSINRQLVLDPVSGVATQVGGVVDNGLVLAGSPLGLDFNPTVDRLRVVSGNDDNLRYNPVTFSVVDNDATPGNGIQPDGDLTYIAGDVRFGTNPTVAASAYDRNDLDPGTPSTLYGIDTGVDALVRQGAVDGNAADAAGGGSPNNGQLSTIGSLGVNIAEASMDIASPLSGPNVAYAATGDGAGNSVLRTINTTTGAATAIGTLPVRLSGLTILPGGSVSFPPLTDNVLMSPPSVQETASTYDVAVSRTGDSLAAATVPYSVDSGSAIAGRDFVAQSGVLSFARGERSKTITVQLTDDTDLEGTEAFVVTLGRPSPGTALGAYPAYVVSIFDNETAPPKGIPPVTVVAPDTTRPVVLTVATAPKSLAALLRSGRLKVPYAATEAGTISFTLKLGSKTVGTARKTITAPAKGTVNVKLSKTGKSTVRKASRAKGSRTVRLTLGTSQTDAAGNKGTSTTRLTTRRR